MKALSSPPAEGPRMSITGHLEELRSRLLKVVWTVLGGMVLAYAASDILIGWLRRPLAGDLYFFSPMEAFWVTVKVSFFAGLFLALPVVLYQIWRFVSPGLHPHERRLAVPFVLIGCLFFVLGLAFCYFVVAPFALNFLVGFGVQQGLKPVISIGLYMDFLLKFLLAFGVVFELPLAITILAKLGLVTPQFLSRYRRYAILVNAILAAILTPTTDVFNMMLMMVPLMVFYELGILGARFFGRKPVRSAVAGEAKSEA
ncbi:MAG TPA: twin-arginine translocase subunit TatC [Nitrospiria bacterium]|nr:twin-arginine translocase subunit TatC [Nitrospiria bacterium]